MYSLICFRSVSFVFAFALVVVCKSTSKKNRRETERCGTGTMALIANNESSNRFGAVDQIVYALDNAMWSAEVLDLSRKYYKK